MQQHMGKLMGEAVGNGSLTVPGIDVQLDIMSYAFLLKIQAVKSGIDILLPCPSNRNRQFLQLAGQDLPVDQQLAIPLRGAAQDLPGKFQFLCLNLDDHWIPS